MVVNINNLYLRLFRLLMQLLPLPFRDAFQAILKLELALYLQFQEACCRQNNNKLIMNIIHFFTQKVINELNRSKCLYTT